MYKDKAKQSSDYTLELGNAHIDLVIIYTTNNMFRFQWLIHQHQTVHMHQLHNFHINMVIHQLQNVQIDMVSQKNSRCKAKHRILLFVDGL